MKNQFVTYEIAIALKELDFDEPCIARFNSDGNLIILRQSATSNMSLVSTIKNSEDITLFIGDVITPICAPLWQQVIDWFITEHGIWITATFGSRSGDNTFGYFGCQIHSAKKDYCIK